MSRTGEWPLEEIEPQSDSSLPRLLEFEALLDRLFTRFISVAPADLDQVLQLALAEIGEFVGADRSYIVRYDDGVAMSWMTHEWCRPGVAPSFDDEQGVPYSAAPASTNGSRRSRSTTSATSGPCRTTGNRTARYLRDQGITAILEVPFSLDGGLDGVIGFDCVSGAVPWQPGDVTALPRHGVADGSGALARRPNGS